MSRLLYTMLISALLVTVTNAQSAHKYKRSGDLMYDQGEYEAAEEEYRRANSKKSSATATYNLGNSIFQQERYDEAIRQYEQAAGLTDDPKLKSKAYYNLGNTYMQAQKFDKSVESYIKALKVDPDDLETKKNLTLALQQLQQQQQQEMQHEMEDMDHEMDDMEDMEDMEHEMEEMEHKMEDQEQKEQDPQEMEDGEEEDQEEAQPSEESQDELTREEAEELLRIIQAEDQKVQEKLRKANSKPRKVKKDW
jgi:Ca-activated chloride channel homolog